MKNNRIARVKKYNKLMQKTKKWLLQESKIFTQEKNCKGKNVKKTFNPI